MAPAVRALTTEQTAETRRMLHPNRVRFAMFSDENPLMQPVKAAAEIVRQSRHPVSADNPLLFMEQATSAWISTCLQSWGAWRDMMTEQMFLTTYGSPLLQALVGLGTDQPLARRGIDRDLLREATEAKRRGDLADRFETGGLPEAMIRSLIYVRTAERSADERGLRDDEGFAAAQPAEKRLSQPQLKEAFTEQFLLLQQDQERALRALPACCRRRPRSGGRHWRRCAAWWPRAVRCRKRERTADGTRWRRCSTPPNQPRRRGKATNV